MTEYYVAVYLARGFSSRCASIYLSCWSRKKATKQLITSEPVAFDEQQNICWPIGWPIGSLWSAWPFVREGLLICSEISATFIFSINQAIINLSSIRCYLLSPISTVSSGWWTEWASCRKYRRWSTTYPTKTEIQQHKQRLNLLDSMQAQVRLIRKPVLQKLAHWPSDLNWLTEPVLRRPEMVWCMEDKLVVTCRLLTLRKTQQSMSCFGQALKTSMLFRWVYALNSEIQSSDQSGEQARVRVRSNSAILYKVPGNIWLLRS